jgi:hypothetical protein
MNAGIADAADLSWLIAATLNGWASPAILDAYEAERRPITEQVSRFAMDIALKNIEQRDRTPDDIEMPGPAGDAARASAGKQAYDLNVQQYCCGGLNFGYFYDGSPIIAYDGGVQPAYSMYDFTPSTVPGCRLRTSGCATAVALRRARARLHAAAFRSVGTVSGLVEAATRRHVPLAVLDVDALNTKELYARNLVLVRPDQHVPGVRRGTSRPGGPHDLTRGARTASTRRAA